MSDFPEFPGKKLFFNKDKGFLQKRVQNLNAYFNTLYKLYPLKIPYTNSIIDLCLPFKLNVAVIGSKGSGKTLLIESIVKALTEKITNMNSPPYDNTK
jgi:Cdc6-like AAA superfamily ATPase